MHSKRNVLLVAGLAGAGKLTALNALEDSGYEVVDGLPLGMITSLTDSFEAEDERISLAIGIDTFRKDFSCEKLAEVLQVLQKTPSVSARLLFLYCSDKEILRRYVETRRSHPLAGKGVELKDGIAKSKLMVKGIEKLATNVIDTTDLNAAGLRLMMRKVFAPEHDTDIHITLMSFSYRNGLPQEADIVLDVRCLRNPHYDERLREHTGLEKAVGEYIKQDSDYAVFFKATKNLLGILIPKYKAEGKSYLTIAFGCTGGRHRSVFIAEEIVRWLGVEGEQVAVRHRELEDKEGAEVKGR